MGITDDLIPKDIFKAISCAQFTYPRSHGVGEIYRLRCSIPLVHILHEHSWSFTFNFFGSVSCSLCKKPNQNPPQFEGLVVLIYRTRLPSIPRCYINCWVLLFAFLLAKVWRGSGERKERKQHCLFLPGTTSDLILGRAEPPSFPWFNPISFSSGGRDANV